VNPGHPHRRPRTGSALHQATLTGPSALRQRNRAVRIEPGAAAYLVAGQRSRERAHAAVLEHLGLEPLLDLRLRAGEGVGAALASDMLISGLKLRRGIGRTAQ